MKKLLFILITLSSLFVKGQIKSDYMYSFDNEFSDLLIDVDKSKIIEIDCSIQVYSMPDNYLIDTETFSFKFLNDSIFEQKFDFDTSSYYGIVKKGLANRYDIDSDTIIYFKKKIPFENFNADSSSYQYNTEGELIYYWGINASKNEIKEYHSQRSDSLDILKCYFMNTYKLKWESYTEIVKEVKDKYILKKSTHNNYHPDAKQKKSIHFYDKSYLYKNEFLEQIVIFDYDNGDKETHDKMVLSLNYKMKK